MPNRTVNEESASRTLPTRVAALMGVSPVRLVSPWRTLIEQLNWPLGVCPLPTFESRAAALRGITGSLDDVIAGTTDLPDLRRA